LEAPLTASSLARRGRAGTVRRLHEVRVILRRLIVALSVASAGCTPGGPSLDPAAFSNPNGWGPRLVWEVSTPDNGYPPSLALSELDEHPDLPNHAFDLSCLGGGRFGLFAYDLVFGHMAPWSPGELLSLASEGRSWSARAVWLTSLMNDSAPSAELAFGFRDLRRLLSHPITVRSGERTATYPPPTMELADRFIAACLSFRGRATLESVTPTIEIVHPGRP
jgi:hypothetical protein